MSLEDGLDTLDDSFGVDPAGERGERKSTGSQHRYSARDDGVNKTQTRRGREQSGESGRCSKRV